MELDLGPAAGDILRVVLSLSIFSVAWLGYFAGAAYARVRDPPHRVVMLVVYGIVAYAVTVGIQCDDYSTSIAWGASVGALVWGAFNGVMVNISDAWSVELAVMDVLSGVCSCILAAAVGVARYALQDMLCLLIVTYVLVASRAPHAEPHAEPHADPGLHVGHTLVGGSLEHGGYGLAGGPREYAGEVRVGSCRHPVVIEVYSAALTGFGVTERYAVHASPDPGARRAINLTYRGAILDWANTTHAGAATEVMNVQGQPLPDTQPPAPGWLQLIVS